jgi:hypothetical protein
MNRDRDTQPRPAPRGKAAAAASNPDRERVLEEQRTLVEHQRELAERSEALARRLAQAVGDEPDGFYMGLRRWEHHREEALRFLAAQAFFDEERRVTEEAQTDGK